MSIHLCKMYYVLVLLLLSVHISLQSAYITPMTASIPGETEIISNSFGNDGLDIADEHFGIDAVDQMSSVESMEASIASNGISYQDQYTKHIQGVDNNIGNSSPEGPKVVESNSKGSSTSTRHHVFIGRSTTHVPVIGILTFIVFMC